MANNNKGLYYALGAIALVGGGYFLYKKFQKKQEEKTKKIVGQQESGNPIEQVGSGATNVLSNIYTGTGDLLGGAVSSIADYLGAFNPYSVNTISSNLYLRDKPDSKGKIIGKFAKGTIVNAKPSSVKGWFAVSEDGKTIKGYVSQVYLKAEPLKK